MNRAFTLLEIIVVVTILGFLAAMLIPYGGRMSESERIKATQDRLEEIRGAIVGPRFAFDVQGRPIVGGYVGDVGDLPPLCEGKLRLGAIDANFATGLLSDSTDIRWSYPTPGVTAIGLAPDGSRSLAHPAALWIDPGLPGWRGPYLSPGREPYRSDHVPYTEDAVPSRDDRSEYGMRLVAERLHDAWGRSLLFWREDAGTVGEPSDDTLWIISEGRNGRSLWTAGIYVKPPIWGGTGDADDLAQPIPASAWRRRQSTAERLAAMPSGAIGTAYDLTFPSYAAARSYIDGFAAAGSPADDWGRPYLVLQDDAAFVGGPDPTQDTSRPVVLLSQGPEHWHGVVTIDSIAYVVPPLIATLADPAAQTAAMVAIINPHRAAVSLPLLLTNDPGITHITAVITAQALKSARGIQTRISVDLP